MKITDLSDKQKPEIVTEFENLTESEASKVVGGTSPFFAAMNRTIWLITQIPKPVSSPANYNGEAPNTRDNFL